MKQGEPKIRHFPLGWKVGVSIAFLLWLSVVKNFAFELTSRLGQPMVPVVVAPQASAATKARAAELAGFLSRISGSQFQVIPHTNPVGIVVGTYSDFPVPQARKHLRVDSYRDRENFVILADRKRMLLLGATELAVSHAVYRFLEELGCRWFFPSQNWEVIPRQKHLAWSGRIFDRPAFASRRIWYGFGFFDQKSHQDYELWGRRNSMASSLGFFGGHAWQTFLLERKALIQAHPEYLALTGGQRQGEQLCLGNAGLRRELIAWALEQFRKDPTKEMVSLEPSDGDGHCECEPCRKLGTISDRVFGMANEAARAVQANFPGKSVGVLAYNLHGDPPSFALEENVHVQMAMGFVRGETTLEERLERWPKLSRNVGIYEYLAVWGSEDFDLPTAGLGSDLAAITQNIRRYHELGLNSIDSESSNNWGPNGLGYYLANKLMWNPDQSSREIVDDFYRKAFGPAHGVMKRYYERIDRGKDPLPGKNMAAHCLRDLEEATRLSETNSEVLSRLDELKLYWRYVALRWSFQAAKTPSEKKQAALAVLEHSFRMRRSYMIHWQPMATYWIESLAQSLKDPEFAAISRNPPWREAQPYSREQIERMFREDVRQFPVVEVSTKAFGTNLVAAGMSQGELHPFSQNYQRGTRHALYSTNAEALTFSLTTGIIPIYRDKPQLVYRVLDAKGKELVKQRLPQDGKEYPLSIPVPRKGLYWLDVQDQDSGWGLTVPAGRYVSLPLTRKAVHPLSLGQRQPLYFYVPRGSKFIEFYWQGGEMGLFGPDQTLKATITGSGDHHRIPVAAGEDGRAWSLHPCGFGRLWFFNVPNYVSSSPQMLLVPIEALAE